MKFKQRDKGLGSRKNIGSNINSLVDQFSLILTKEDEMQNIK
jgi:hypothetical protein